MNALDRRDARTGHASAWEPNEPRDTVDAMFKVVLVQPEIPPNTGNVIRLCANTGCALHLVEPLGFPIDHARMRRAGLDYRELTTLSVHRSWPELRAIIGTDRMFAMTTHAERHPTAVAFEPGDWLVFGRETSGLSEAVLGDLPPEHRLRIPMQPGNRSLNLSNAVAVVVFEAWRQNGYFGAERP
jgi:tRNA (cytidine/uridine-2'-O-)-methyltransferase